MSEDMGIDNINPEGKYIQPIPMTDYEYMKNNMISIPDKEIKTAYYAIERNGKTYHVFNAERIPFGKMCVDISSIIRGKHKPIYKRIDPTLGDKVIVVNAEKALFMGRKLKFKNLKYHTGRAGGLKTKMFKDILHQKPELLIFNSVYKMLPKNRTRFVLLDNLKIYSGSNLDNMDFLPNFTPNPHLNFNEYVDLRMDPKKHVLTNYQKDIPYEFKDFKVDLDFETKRLEDLRNNYKSVSTKERERFNSLNKHIMDKR